jgi:PAS domain S-box-containing protein
LIAGFVESVWSNMMPDFDIQTAYLIVGMLYLIMPVTAWIILAGQHSRAVALWCGGGLMFGIGLLLIGLRDQAPPWLSYSLANLLIFLSNLWRLQALRIELATPWRKTWLAVGAAVVYLLVFEGIRLGLGDVTLRHQFTSLVQAGLLLYLVALAWRLGREQHSHSARWIAAAYLSVVAMLVVRIVFLAGGWSAVDFTESSYDLVLLALAGILAAVVGHVGYVGIALERSLRQQVEAAARQASDQRLAAVAEQRVVGVVEADLDGRLLRCNDRYCEMVGYPREQLLGRRWQELGRCEDVQANQALLDALPSGDVLPVIERCHRHPDGTLVWVNVSGAVIRDSAGQAVSTLGVALDITERKQWEERLRASERRFRELFEYLPLAYQSLDIRGCYIDANQALADLLGFAKPEDLLGRSFGDVWAEEVRSDFERCYADFKAKHRILSELKLSRRDGQRVTVMLAGRIQHDDDGNVQRTHCILVDISDRLAMEEAIRQWNVELEQKVAHRTAELAAANAAKSDFLANMSHEIRTPMNGVIGMTGLLLDTALNAAQRRYAETIRTSGQSLLTLLNDILDLSKIEAGRLELEAVDFDLQTLLDDFAAPLALRAHEKGLDFICAAAPNVPSSVRGDPGRLRQILNNLASNAVKFTERGEVSVLVSLVSQTDAEIMLRFTIRDTGIGIPLEQQQLFRRFTQADASTTRRYGGSGLGLVISKELVELMGGEIGMSSQVGYGSEFWCTVRLDQPAQWVRPVTAWASLQDQHILVVDDNATHREVLLAQLAAWGVRAEAVPDGPVALQTLAGARDAGDPFRAAILDLQMPGMDGAALAQAIQADSTLRNTRIVLLTSLIQRGVAEDALQPGLGGAQSVAYLTKPVRPSELGNRLVAAVAETSVTQPAPNRLTPPTLPAVYRCGARILVAEDNVVNQEVALGMLRKLGLYADAVANGAEAVAALTSVPYDLVLMDIQMPEVDGLEATRIIRHPQSNVLDHAIPIIAMTASAMPGDRERCLAAGMNDYTTKPVSPQALIEALNTWLPQKPAETAPPPSLLTVATATLRCAQTTEPSGRRYRFSIAKSGISPAFNRATFSSSAGRSSGWVICLQSLAASSSRVRPMICNRRSFTSSRHPVCASSRAPPSGACSNMARNLASDSASCANASTTCVWAATSSAVRA